MSASTVGPSGRTTPSARQAALLKLADAIEEHADEIVAAFFDHVERDVEFPGVADRGSMPVRQPSRAGIEV